MITGSLDAVPPRFSATGVYHRRERHAEHSGDFPPASALSAQTKCLVPPKYPPGPPEPCTAPLCRTNARHNALPDEFPLEFRECGEDVQEQPGGGVALVGVDILGHGHEPNAERSQLLNAADAVGQALLSWKFAITVLLDLFGLSNGKNQDCSCRFHLLVPGTGAMNPMTATAARRFA